MNKVRFRTRNITYKSVPL